MKTEQTQTTQPDALAGLAGLPIYTVESAAALLGMSVRTVRAEANTGRLPGRKRAGRWYFLPEDLRAYVAGGEPNTGREQKQRINPLKD